MCVCVVLPRPSNSYHDLKNEKKHKKVRPKEYQSRLGMTFQDCNPSAKHFSLFFPVAHDSS
jgi:hypothetical protein